MTIETELSRLSIGLVSEPHVRVTRQFLGDVLAHLNKQAAEIAKLKAKAADRKICDCCETLMPGFEIPASCNSPPYEALSRARIDRLQEKHEQVEAGMR